MPLNEQAEKGITLAVVINSDNQGRIDLLLPYNGGKDKNFWSVGDPLRYLLVLLHPMIKVGGKLSINLGRTPNIPDPSGIKFWVAPPIKEPKEVKCLLRTKGIVINTCYAHMINAKMRNVIVMNIFLILIFLII